MVEMLVTSISMDPYTNTPFLLLESKDKKHKMPIWVGLFEASAIAVKLENIQLARPMTHDLLKNLMVQAGVKVKSVEIHDLQNNTFFSRINIEQNGKPATIDSRPSDAIAIALRMSSPILVATSVIDKASNIEFSKAAQDKDKVSKEKWKEILENLTPEDFGEYKM